MFEDNYPPPNDTARANAADAAERLRAAGLTPESPEVPSGGGVAVYAFGCIAKYAAVACWNTGFVGCVLSGLSVDDHGNQRVRTWDIATVGWPETITRIKAHFAEVET
jgi:hypothetical protein